MALRRLDPKRLLAAIFLIATLLPAAARPGEPEDFKAISDLLSLGVTRSALNRCKLYLSRYPEGPHRAQVSAWGGNLLLQAGNPSEALPLLQEAASGGPIEDQDGVRLDLCEALIDLGQPAEALGVLQGVKPAQEAEQERLSDLAGRAKAAQAKGESGPAPAQGGPAAPKAPSPASPEPVPPRALALSPTPPPAAPEKEKLPAALPTSAPSQQAPEAAPAEPSPSSLRLQEALALAEKGHDEEAVGALKKLLADGSLDPAVAKESRLALGTSLYRLGRFDQSIQVLAPLTGGKSPDAGALLLSAWDLHRMGHDEKAYEAVRKASPLPGWREASALEPARLAAVEREPEVVLAAAQDVLKDPQEGPAAVRALLLSARAYEQLGDAASALKALEGALPQMPAGEEQYMEALSAARIAWQDVRDAKRAARWLVLAAQSAPDDAARARVKLAEARMGWERGESTEALQALAEITKLYPNTPSMPEAYLLLGRMLMAEGNRERAFEALKVVGNSFPSSPAYAEASLVQAESLLALGRGADAAQVLKAIEGRALPPELERKRLRLQAQVTLSQGDCGKAAALLAQAEALRGDLSEEDFFSTLACGQRNGRIDESLDSADSLKDPVLRKALRFRAAEAMEAAGKGTQARDLWGELAAEGGPDGALALWCLADGQLAAGLDVEGLASMKALAAFTAEEPLATLAQYRLERYFLDKRDAGAALANIAVFRRAEPPRAGEAEELLSAAREKTRTGNAAAGRELYQTYLDRFPGKPGAGEASLAVAKEAAARGDWAGARKILEKIPSSPAGDLLLGQACLNLGDPEASQAVVERALGSSLELGPDGVCQANLLAAEAAVARGKTAEATAHYSGYARYVKATKSNKEALLDAALFLQEQGQYDDALAAFDKLLKVTKDPAVPFQYAYTLELSGRKEEALKAFLKAAKSPSPMWAPTARYRAAELYADLGHFKEAIAIYKDMAVSAKGTVQGDFAKQRLQELQDELAESQPASKKPATEKEPALKKGAAKPATEKQPALKKSSAKPPATKPAAQKPTLKKGSGTLPAAKPAVKKKSATAKKPASKIESPPKTKTKDNP